MFVSWLSTEWVTITVTMKNIDLPKFSIAEVSFCKQSNSVIIMLVPDVIFYMGNPFIANDFSSSSLKPRLTIFHMFPGTLRCSFSLFCTCFTNRRQCDQLQPDVCEENLAERSNRAHWLARPLRSPPLVRRHRVPRFEPASTISFFVVLHEQLF